MKEKCLFLRMLSTKLLEIEAEMVLLICIYFLTKSVVKIIFIQSLDLKNTLSIELIFFQSLDFCFLAQFFHGFCKIMNILNTF